MPAADGMGDLMGQNPGQFIRAGKGCDQSPVYKDVCPRAGKGIERAVIDQVKGKIERLGRQLCQYMPADFIDQMIGRRII